MTGLQRRLDNILAEMTLIREALENHPDNPPCCLIIYKNGKISCDAMEPMDKDQFYKKCKECQARIKKFIQKIPNQY